MLDPRMALLRTAALLGWKLIDIRRQRRALEPKRSGRFATTMEQSDSRMVNEPCPHIARRGWRRWRICLTIRQSSQARIAACRSWVDCKEAIGLHQGGMLP